MVVSIGAPQTSPTWDQISGKPDFTALGDLPEATTTATAPIAANALLGATTRFNLTATGTQPLPAALPGRRLRIGSDGGATLSIAAASGDVVGAGSATTIAGPLLRCASELRCTVAGRWRVTVGYLEPDVLDGRYLARPHVRKRRTGADSAALPTGTTSVPLDTTEVDRNSSGVFSLTTANAITMLVAGLVLVNAELLLFGGSSGFRTLLMQKNGVTLREFGFTTGTTRLAGAWPVPLAVGDVITLALYHECTTGPVLRSTSSADVGLALTYLGT